MPSKPVTDSSRGTAKPSAEAREMKPIAVRSLAHTTAVGGSARPGR